MTTRRNREIGNHHFTFKFVIVGNSNVGKTCMLAQFTKSEFMPNSKSTVNCEFGMNVITIKGVPIKLQIWDTAGTEKYRSIVRSYYRGAAACLLVYDVTDRSSFESITEWLEEITELTHQHITIHLIGNKCDLESQRKVPYDEGARLARSVGIDFHETSAMNGRNVEKVFTRAGIDVYDKVESGKLDLNDESTFGVKWGPHYSNRDVGKRNVKPSMADDEGMQALSCCL